MGVASATEDISINTTNDASDISYSDNTNVVLSDSVDDNYIDLAESESALSEYEISVNKQDDILNSNIDSNDKLSDSVSLNEISNVDLLDKSKESNIQSVDYWGTETDVYDWDDK